MRKKNKFPLHEVITEVTRKALRLHKVYAAGEKTDYETLCAMAAWAKQKDYKSQWHSINKKLEQEHQDKNWFWLVNQLHRYPELWYV